MRLVSLTISSAKVVNNNLGDFHKNCLDTVCLSKQGKSINDMENVIHVNHIINALHVMLGARPISIKYGNTNKWSKKIVDIVEIGIIRYDNKFKHEFVDKNGNKVVKYYNEFTQGKKPFYNSNRKISTTSSNYEVYPLYITWSYLKKKFIYSPQYNEIYKIILDFGKFINCPNVEKDYTLIDLLIFIRDKHPIWAEKIKNIPKISPIIKILNKEKKGEEFNHIDYRNLSSIGNVNATTPKVSVDATIILFMEDEDVENLLNGKQHATILDNGLINLSHNLNSVNDFSVVDDIEYCIDYHLSEGFTKIKNLPYTNGTYQN